VLVNDPSNTNPKELLRGINMPLSEITNRLSYPERTKIIVKEFIGSSLPALPNVLVLSLKRFDLDYNTFETIQLNTRCAFGRTLNMKKYTLEGVSATKNTVPNEVNESIFAMEMEDGKSSRGKKSQMLSNDEYDYNLAVILVPARVAQGGHYSSFIKDRSNTASSEPKWYKFDDEDVSTFDPSLIEQECFGGERNKVCKCLDAFLRKD
jgi:ubiquitin carboxyl-terminal hydrolase 9/24